MSKESVLKFVIPIGHKTLKVNREEAKAILVYLRDLFPSGHDRRFAEAQVHSSNADVRRIDAEIELVTEKTNTEKINQAVSIANAGVDIDYEKIVAKRSTVIS